MQQIVRICLILSVFCGVWTKSLDSVSRKKRSFIELGIITQHVTGLTYAEMWKLYQYGCWCGVGGSGTPKDAIDQCCKDHDQCYDAYNAGSWWTRQCKIDFRLLPYSFNCNGGTCTCNNSSGSCAGKACRCDVSFAECVKRNLGVWNNNYVGFC